MNKYLKYDPMEFSIDSGIVSGIILAIISLGYYMSGHPTYTSYNFWISFIASTCQMSIAMIGLNAMVKGLAGPTGAIM